ncbi:MAG: hypothetical protein ABI681_00305 [Gemmatimonadales bacterium]
MRPAATVTAAIATTFLSLACSGTEPTAVTMTPRAPSFAKGAESDAVYSPVLDRARQAYLARNPNVALWSAELRVKQGAAGWEGKTTLIANDRGHTFGSEFVERDPRRGGGADITYLVDQSDGSVLSFVPPSSVFLLPNSVTEPEVDASMAVWQNKAGCAAPAATKVADNGADPDLVDGIVLADAGLIGTPFADVTHAGWLSSAFFNALTPGGATFILGATFTFVFIDGDGNPTDIDRNGVADVAFREIYYNRSFPWTTNASNDFSVDIQSVVIHESGHAYGLGHFGKVFLDNNGFIRHSPLAMMNAVYVGSFRRLTGTDNGSFCQIWAN